MAQKKNEPKRKIIAQNRKARHNYYITESFEAGIMLVGSELKTLRTSGASIEEAWAGPKEGDIWLFNAYIQEYKHAAWQNHEPKRPRKLLLHKREIAKLGVKVEQKGVTLVPLSLYFNERGRVKLELGLAAGKQLHDKRQTEKEKDWNRQKQRLLREYK